MDLLKGNELQFSPTDRRVQAQRNAQWSTTTTTDRCNVYMVQPFILPLQHYLVWSNQAESKPIKFHSRQSSQVTCKWITTKCLKASVMQATSQNFIDMKEKGKFSKYRRAVEARPSCISLWLKGSIQTKSEGNYLVVYIIYKVEVEDVNRRVFACICSWQGTYWRWHHGINVADAKRGLSTT